MKKVSCSIVLPGRVVKSLLRNIVYDDFTENSQAVAAPPQDIFLEESSTSQFNTMALSILIVSLKVA